jgi:crossover junction endodeoxyribonuclease RuvC
VLILGLDPGSVHTGYGVVEAHGTRLTLVEGGRISLPARQPLPARLAELARELAGLVDRLEPEVVVLETPFHGLNPRSLIVLAQARGALLSVVGGRRVEIREYSPAEIKSAVAGNGRADKQQVARMVRLLLRLEGELAPDATDALAVAICAAHRDRSDRISALAERR